MPVRARFSPDTPFNTLPLLPPKVELETKAVMKALVAARAALAELKQAGELIPNQSILINTLPVLEARASSEIEDIAKGLEFRAVAVMACDDEVLPLQARIESVGDDADLQEVYDTERHLLYVACTRAREHLHVSGVEPMSEFVDDLKP